MSTPSDVAVLVLAHANPGVFGRLMAALQHPNLAIFCHIDAKANAQAFQSRAPASVTFLKERTSIGWGGYSMIEAELALFRAAQAAGPFAAYALISGDTLPLMDNDALVTLMTRMQHMLPCQRQFPTDNGHARFDRLFLPDTSIGSFRGKKYIERYLDARDFDLIRRAMAVHENPLRKTYQYFKGSQWFSVSDAYLTTMLNYLAAHPDYEEIFRFTAMPDESFFPTLLRLIDPAPPKGISLVGVDWTRDPMPYTMKLDSDLACVQASKAPFYRKFSDECLTLVDTVLAQRRSQQDIAAQGGTEISRVLRRRA